MMQSKAVSECSVTAVTQGVVTPNMVSAIGGLPVPAAGPALVMPTMPNAAFVQHGAACVVETGEVSGRGRHRHVRDIDIVADIAGGER